MSYAVATSTDFLIRVVVRASLTRKSDTSDDTSDDASDFLVRSSDDRFSAGRQKTSSEEIGTNEHALSVRFFGQGF